MIIRGLERRRIFRDNKDQDDFLARLGDLIPETGTFCYAWTLLTNHAHILLRTGRSPISTFMRRLLTGYAGRFNRRHNRYGPLFQNRFKSIVCQEDVYLKELVRYIHLNPLRAGIVPDLRGLNTYPYCGHSALMGRREFEWQETGYVLKYFGKRLSDARKSYYDLSVGDIYSKSREKVKAQARGLFCYWAVRELGHSMLEMARRLGMSQPGVVYAVRRGERIAAERELTLAG